MKWFEKVVTADTVKAAKRIAEACGDSFWLAGGTALALRFGHRISLDLDLFSTKNKLSTQERSLILERLRSSGAVSIRTNEDRTCHLILGKTQVSLFHYPYPLIARGEKWNGLSVASVEDICGMKLSAVLGRGSKKDFVDLYVIANKLGLERAFEIGEQKFPDHTNFVLQAARALVFFEDAETEPMPRMLAKINWNEIKQYFSKRVPAYIKKLI